MEEISSKFNINLTRDLFLHGEPHHLALIRKLVKGYYFLQPRDIAELGSYRDETFFALAAVDFTSAAKMQAAAKVMSSVEAPLAHRIVYVVTPNELSREQLLFAQEIGARYVAAGPGKHDELKEYLKRVCIEAHQVGSLAAIEADLNAALRAEDRDAAARVIERLKEIPHASEEATRLLAIASLQTAAYRRAEIYLKKLLRTNPQNLWAANTLGKLYLRSGRAAQGIEVLEKLSQFHELNSERCLTLGNAYVQAGMTLDAEESFATGLALIGGKDERFIEGKAKVRLAEQDFDGALSLLGSKTFSPDVISFLNMRAIMAIRSQRFDEGILYYEQAIAGAGEAKDVQAKLKFNLGLAYVRRGDLLQAQECFFESCQLGGPRFQRARGPLDVVKNILKNQETRHSDLDAITMFDDSEWETLY